MRKRLTYTVCCVILLLCAGAALTACGKAWFEDGTSGNPEYHPIVEDDADSTSGGEEHETKYVTFILQLRQPTDELETEDWDSYPHSKIDGELVAEWEIPVYGNTLYESVVEYFKDKDEDFSFRLVQHKFYMFHECTLADGATYNLETVYIAADGKYAYCANYQSLLGEDGIAGTDDDVKTVVLVYRGWLY